MVAVQDRRNELLFQDQILAATVYYWNYSCSMLLQLKMAGDVIYTIHETRRVSDHLIVSVHS
jgi:hypothetical protein